MEGSEESNAPPTALGYFQQELDRCTFTADGGRQIVCFSLLREWLHSTPPHDAVSDILASSGGSANGDCVGALGRGWIDLLLHELFPSGDAPPDLAGKLADDSDGDGGGGCLKIFCILLKIGGGAYIRHLSHLGDEELPLQREDLEYYLAGDGASASATVAAAGEEEAEEDAVARRAADFCAQQYAFLAKVFGGFQTLLRRYAAPIYRREAIEALETEARREREGPAGSRFSKVLVPEEFVVPKIRDALKGTSAVTLSPQGIKLFALALKTFSDERSFRAEREANRKLGDHEHMVRVFGEYSHDSPDEGKTFNFIMQLPQTDLDGFLAKPAPERPMWPTRYHLFWSRLFDVARAVEFIHNHRGESGIHQDVRPENIFLVEGKLRLSGLATANFRAGPRTADNRFIFSGPNNLWSAPETSIGPNALVKAEIDIWNLGCIFSVAATWIILGPHHVKVYEQLRLDAVSQTLCKKTNNGAAAAAATTTGGSTTAASTSPSLLSARIPYFHDGNAPLQVIIQWHRYLRSMVRPNDHVTPRVLDVVERDMLQEAGTRASATRLRSSLDRVLQAPYEKEVVKPPFSAKIEAAYARVVGSAEADGGHGPGPLDDLVDVADSMSSSSNYVASPGFGDFGEEDPMAAERQGGGGGGGAVGSTSAYDDDGIGLGSNFASQRTSRRSDQSYSSANVRRPVSAQQQAWTSRRAALNLSAAGQEQDREIPDGIELVREEEDEETLQHQQQQAAAVGMTSTLDQPGRRLAASPMPLNLNQPTRTPASWEYTSANSSVVSPEIPQRSPQRSSRSPGLTSEVITPPLQPDGHEEYLQRQQQQQQQQQPYHVPLASPPGSGLQRQMSQTSSIRTQSFGVVHHPTISDLRPKYEVDKGLHGRAWHTVRAGINRGLNVRPLNRDDSGSLGLGGSGYGGGSGSGSNPAARDGVLDLNLTDDTDYELLVDDGPGSAEHWDQMTKAVETLATVFAVHDRARLGLSLAFGGRVAECSSTVDPKKFRRALDRRNAKKAADGGDLSSWETMNAARTLERMFMPYRDVLQRSRMRPRDRAIILLTDGGWWATNQADEVADRMDRWVHELKVHYPGETNTAHFGVEVVLFGRDEQIRMGLQRLAYDIQTRSGWDIMDTTPILGSAYRIILGATKRHMRVDVADPPLSPPLTSPSQSVRSESVSGMKSPVGGGAPESLYSSNGGGGGGGGGGVNMRRGSNAMSIGAASTATTSAKSPSVNSKDGRWVIIRGGRTSRKVWIPADKPIPPGAALVH